MSFFDTANQDSYRGTLDDASAGPRLGFQEAFSAAWDATTKAHSLLAVEQGLRAVEQTQIKKIREAGLRPPDSLDDAEQSPVATMFRQGRYSAAAQSIVDGGGWYTDEMVAARDEHLRKLQADRPDLGILTYGDMFKQVQADAQEAEKRAELPKTTAGHIGAFLGEAAGSLDPSSNPVNFASMGIGGGTGILGRAAVQGVVQGSAEAVNLAVSQPENLLLGRPRTPGEDVGRIGMAMAAGAGADLLLSGASAAIRRARTGRWFVDQPLPDPPAPRVEPSTAQVFQGEVPPTPKAGLPLHEYPDWETFARAHGEEPNLYGPSPAAKKRTAADLNYVSEELNKWDGPAPWELRPPSTDTALPRAVEPGVEISIAPGAYTRYLDNLETVHDIARRIDPDTFRQYDTLQRNIEELRAGIERDKATPTFFDAQEMDRRARELAARQLIQKFDQQMRDMAPLVSRAYGLAEREWRTLPLDHDTVAFFRSIEESDAKWRYRGDGKPSLTEQPPRLRTPDQTPVSPKTVDDAVPLASMEPGIDNRLHVDTDTAAARVKQNVAHTIEKLDEKVEQFATHAEKMAKLEAKDVATQTKVLEEKLTTLRAERSEVYNADAYKLTVARRMPDGTVVVGQPGDMHAHLLTEDEVNDKGFIIGNDRNEQMGFATKDGTFLTRTEALQWVRDHDPAKLTGGNAKVNRRYGLEAADYVKSTGDKTRYLKPPKAKLKTPEERAAASEAIAKAEKALDELHYVTFPDGRKLHLDNDRAPFVHDDGRVEELSVRDFLREMAKDQDALKSVVTCSRPS